MFKKLEEHLQTEKATNERTAVRVYEIRELMGWVNVWIPLIATLLMINLIITGITMSWIHDTKNDTKYIREYIEEKQRK